MYYVIENHWISSVSERLSTEMKLHWIGWWIAEWRSRSWWERDGEVRMNGRYEMTYDDVSLRSFRHAKWWMVLRKTSECVLAYALSDVLKSRLLFFCLHFFLGPHTSHNLRIISPSLAFNALWIRNFMDNTNGTTYSEFVAFVPFGMQFSLPPRTCAFNTPWTHQFISKLHSTYRVWWVKLLR